MEKQELFLLDSNQRQMILEKQLDDKEFFFSLFFLYKEGFTKESASSLCDLYQNQLEKRN